MPRYNVDVKIVPKNKPNADSESFFIIELDEQQAHQLKFGSWRTMAEVLEPFIPPTHFLVAVQNIEVING